jgi:hypothetical protein
MTDVSEEDTASIIRVVITLIFLMSESDCRPDDGGSKLF